LLQVPVLGAHDALAAFPGLPWQAVLLFGLAILVVLDGLFGPQVAAMNFAGVLPWTHWRGFTILALLIVGNFLCMACPFTFARDLGRKIFPATHAMAARSFVPSGWPSLCSSSFLGIRVFDLSEHAVVDGLDCSFSTSPLPFWWMDFSRGRASANMSVLSDNSISSLPHLAFGGARSRCVSLRGMPHPRLPARK
jgi:hypothetical protein